MGANKDKYYINYNDENDYPDVDELEYLDKLQVSKKRNARIAKQDRNQIDDLDYYSVKRDKKNDKSI